MDVKLRLVKCRLPRDDYKLPGTAYLQVSPTVLKMKSPKFLLKNEWM